TSHNVTGVAQTAPTGTPSPATSMGMPALSSYIGVDPVSWTPFHLRRRCWDAEESPAIRAGISAPDGRAGAVRPKAGRAVTRVRANGASDLELGAPSRTWCWPPR